MEIQNLIVSTEMLTFLQMILDAHGRWVSYSFPIVKCYKRIQTSDKIQSSEILLAFFGL